jgi:hypothetical protein
VTRNEIGKEDFPMNRPSGIDFVAWGFALAACIIAAPQVRGAEGKEAEKVFRAGAYAMDVTPKQFPVIVNGGMLERTADKVVDPLHARCLVLDDGAMQVAIAVVDSCLIPRSIMDAAKEQASEATGIPTERMLISATHCHSAPSVVGALGSSPDETYAKSLPGRIAEGIIEAHKRLAPARIGWAVGEDPKNVYCRRFRMKPGTARTCPFTGKTDDRAQMNPGHSNPNAIERTGPRDTEVSVLAVQTPDGTPVAVLGNYSTHYAGAPAVSADYFGVFCKRIGELVGTGESNPNFVGLMTNGTSGDANCLDFTCESRRKYDRFTVGEDVAQAAFAAYKTIRFHDWAPLAMVERRLTLRIRQPDEGELVKAREFLKPLDGGKPKNTAQVYAREAVLLSQMPPTRELKLQALRIGSLGIASIPCEVFGSTGLAIKKDSPLETTFTIELANGYHGYIPPPEQHKLGGYTTWRARSSCLEEQAEPKIRAVVLELLRDVAAQREGEAPVPSS